jgi:hypothetical protein
MRGLAGGSSGRNERTTADSQRSRLRLSQPAGSQIQRPTYTSHRGPLEDTSWLAAKAAAGTDRRLVCRAEVHGVSRKRRRGDEACEPLQLMNPDQYREKYGHDPVPPDRTAEV